MWQVLWIIWLALAVSIDSFGVGVTYGIRKIRIPFLSILVIGICSGLIIYVMMRLGNWIALWFTPETAQLMGAILLICLGIWALFQPYSLPKEKRKKERKIVPPEGWTFQLKTLGLMIQILRTPDVADLDESGVISMKEAFILGGALSLDALGAGLGAAFLTLPADLVALAIALMSILFLRLGMWMGFRLFRRRESAWISTLPGILLIFIGLLRLF
jgi:putative sporulation protein YtaF